MGIVFEKNQELQGSQPSPPKWKLFLQLCQTSQLQGSLFYHDRLFSVHRTLSHAISYLAEDLLCKKPFEWSVLSPSLSVLYLHLSKCNFTSSSCPLSLVPQKWEEKEHFSLVGSNTEQCQNEQFLCQDLRYFEVSYSLDGEATRTSMLWSEEAKSRPLNVFFLVFSLQSQQRFL